MKIKCRVCGKEIEKKGKRLLCVHCTNVRNREIAKKYRDELAEMKKESWLKKR